MFILSSITADNTFIGPLVHALSDKTKSDKILVTSKDFGHFSPTNNFVYFEISKYDLISILLYYEAINYK